MKVLVVALLAALAVASSALALDTKTQECQACQFLQSTLAITGASGSKLSASSKLGESDLGRAQLTDAVTSALRASLASTTQQQCQARVGQPAELCANPTLAGLNAFECPLCEFVVARAVQELEDPNTEAGIVSAAREACDTLGEELAQQCYALVDSYSIALFQLVRDIDPQGVCMLAGACGPARLPRKLRAAMGGLALARRLPTLGASDGQECSTCQLVVMEVGAILRNPETQQEVLDYAKQACETFQGFHDECVQYVVQYGPLAFELLEEYLQPIPLCTDIGFCSASIAAGTSR